MSAPFFQGMPWDDAWDIEAEPPQPMPTLRGTIAPNESLTSPPVPERAANIPQLRGSINDLPALPRPTYRRPVESGFTYFLQDLFDPVLGPGGTRGLAMDLTERSMGLARAAGAGLGEAKKDFRQTYETVTGGDYKRLAPSAPQLFQPLTLQGAWDDPRGAAEKVTAQAARFGVVAASAAGGALAAVAAAPAAASAGAVAGAALLGSAGAAGLSTLLQVLGTNYEEAIKLNPGDTDAAYWTAVKLTAGDTALGAASGLLGGANPFSTMLKNLLAQTFVVQPAVGVVQGQFHADVTGQETGLSLADEYFGATVAGIPMAAVSPVHGLLVGADGIWSRQDGLEPTKWPWSKTGDAYEIDPTTAAAVPEEPTSQASRMRLQTAADQASAVPLTTAEIRQHADVIRSTDAAIREIAPLANIHATKTLGGGVEEGAYMQGRDIGRLIVYALDDGSGGMPDTHRVGRHEAWHWLEENGLVRPDEQAAIKEHAKAEDWHGKHKIGERYADLDAKGQMSEAIADGFSKGRPTLFKGYPKLVRQAFLRIHGLLTKIAVGARRAFGKAPTAEQVMRLIESGSIGRRQKKPYHADPSALYPRDEYGPARFLGTPGARGLQSQPGSDQTEPTAIPRGSNLTPPEEYRRPPKFPKEFVMPEGIIAERNVGFDPRAGGRTMFSRGQPAPKALGRSPLDETVTDRTEAVFNRQFAPEQGADPISSGFQPKDIRPPTESLATVAESNFVGSVKNADRTMPIDKLTGGVRMNDPREKARVERLAEKMKSDDGYFERIIVDRDGSVIEGQHRLEALRLLGAKEVPVVEMRGATDGLPMIEMKDAISKAAPTNSDHVNQIINQIGEALSDVETTARVRAEYEPPRGFEKQWNAALDAIDRKAEKQPAPRNLADLIPRATSERTEAAFNRQFVEEPKLQRAEGLARTPQDVMLSIRDNADFEKSPDAVKQEIADYYQRLRNGEEPKAASETLSDPAAEILGRPPATVDGKRIADVEMLTPDQERQHTVIINNFRSVLSEIAPRAMTKVFARIDKGGAKGAYFTTPEGQSLIGMALESNEGPNTDSAGTAWHEGGHWLLDNVATKPEANAIFDLAEKSGWRDKHNIEARYPNKTEAQKTEEAVVEEFRAGRSTRWEGYPKLVRAPFLRFHGLLTKIAIAARRVVGKDATGEQVMKLMRSGAMGRRKSLTIDQRRRLGRLPASKSSATETKFQRGDDPKRPKGITAYHASPHTFDKFDMGKVGTGQGAQSYGHGIYAAESEAVSGRGGTYDREFTAGKLGQSDTTAQQEAILRHMKPGVSDMDILDKLHRDGYVSKASDGHPDFDQAEAMIKRIRENKSSIYQVRLNVKPDELLDWDKPLSEQPESIRKAVSERGWATPPRGFQGGSEPRGENIHAWATDRIGDKWNVPGTAEKLKAAGIKGIRYKDAGSRSGEGGTYNYVIFDAKLIDILKRYGVAMTVGAAGTAIVSGKDMPDELAAQMGAES